MLLRLYGLSRDEKQRRGGDGHRAEVIVLPVGRQFFRGTSWSVTTAIFNDVEEEIE